MYVLVSRAAGQTEAHQSSSASQAGRGSAGAEAAKAFKPLKGSPMGQRWGSEKDRGGV